MTEKKATKKTSVRGKAGSAFSAEEREAMKERAREAKRGANKEDGAREVLAKIASMPEPDRSMGKRIHEIVTEVAPHLTPRTWYGMPAYTKDDKVVCFFQNASKFKARYSTLGFNDAAKLDAGAMWPVTFAITNLTPTEEAKIRTLVKKAAR